ncbi:group-specific protein [Bacillus sinesaloumensis]|uniref:group-specific protein n=1 Tax=Litchfieldia sinesaloumensis TaxID=1926280 RepID=UPI00098848BB|nr:group-specific protein [Bacillus sinesaloumensis]
MSACTIDHSKEDVIKKLESQKSYLPEELYNTATHFLKEDRSQQALNELFHLLKKYDLVTQEEQHERNLAIEKLFLL